MGKPLVPGTAKLVFAVDDVRAAHIALLRRGVVFAHAPRNVNGMEWAAAFRDPDGHLRALCTEEHASVSQMSSTTRILPEKAPPRHRAL